MPSGDRATSTDSIAAGEDVRTVWFHREYVRLTGGHLKHSHYVDHVRRTEGFTPRIAFGCDPPDEVRAQERRRLWSAAERATDERWAPGRRDLLFLAGIDWRFLERSGLVGLANPRINLIQGVRHAHEGSELFGYLSERAVRICVSREVADAVSATGRTLGPVLTIPNGIDVTPCSRDADGLPAGYRMRPLAVVIAGSKRPELARALSERLQAVQIEHRLLTDFMDREAFLTLVEQSRVVVCLPRAEEGFHLPALEGMAIGAIVVTLDCIGNRGFCHHEDNCLIAGPEPESLYRETRKALALSAAERARIHRRARDTADRHSLEAERARFQAILRDIDRLWLME